MDRMLAWIVAALIVFRLGAQLALNALNAVEVRRRAADPPAAVAALMDGETYGRAVAYTLARLRLGSVEEIYEAAVLAVMLFSGLLPWIHGPFAAAWHGASWSGALFLLAAGVVVSAPSLPFEWWQQFRLEQRFGFNRSTFGLWVADHVKGLLVSAVIGFPLLWALLALVRLAGSAWWLWGFALVYAVQLLLLVLYPRLILPLFNKLGPLADAGLRERLLALAERTGFRARTIQTMDGSRRSSHSNAFFTGFGRFRRIVLFDTLVEQLTPEELEAVLAHEIGHYKRGHVPKMLLLSAGGLLGGFAVLAWLARAPWFNPAFGFAPGALAPSFLLFGLLSGLATFWLLPLVNLFSRLNEYEADAFARAAVGVEPMVGALRKLAQKNLSNLTPHPLYSGFHYSHPTIIEREAALRAE